MIVDAPLQRGFERRGDAELVAAIEGLASNRAEISAPDVEQGVALERIELQVDFSPPELVGEPAREVGAS